MGNNRIDMKCTACFSEDYRKAMLEMARYHASEAEDFMLSAKRNARIGNEVPARTQTALSEWHENTAEFARRLAERGPKDD